jgi:hypothetical protein
LGRCDALPTKISLNPSLEKREVHGGDLDTSCGMEFKQTPSIGAAFGAFLPGNPRQCWSLSNFSYASKIRDLNLA